MDTRRGKKCTVEAARLNYQVGTRCSRRADPASHITTIGTPTNDATVAAIHTAPTLDVDALVNNISSAIVSQLGNMVRTVEEYGEERSN